MMNKTQISEMLSVMSDMTKAACEGMNFVEISTYVRNHCPGIEPEFVEVFRDMLCPIINQYHSGYFYAVVVCEYGTKHLETFDGRKPCEEFADGYCGDNGFAYIYTTDPNVKDRDQYEGGKYYFTRESHARAALVADFPNFEGMI